MVRLVNVNGVTAVLTRMSVGVGVGVGVGVPESCTGSLALSLALFVVFLTVLYALTFCRRSPLYPVP
jgi:hypothetical protein